MVSIEKSLGSELDKYLPIYSRKVNFIVSMTGFVEKVIRECLERKKEEDFITMGKSQRKTNISRTDDLLVPDHDASAAPPVAGCAFAHLIHQS